MKQRARMKKLPDKLSELILLALDDLELCEADPRYVIDMGFWHLPNFPEDGQCSVCLAGSVMSQTLKVRIGTNKCPSNTSQHHKLRALDYIRRGDLPTSLHEMGVGRAELYHPMEVEVYDINPDRFKLELTILAYGLKTLGL